MPWGAVEGSGTRRICRDYLRAHAKAQCCFLWADWERRGTAGIPILIIGLLGCSSHDLVPNVISFSDFVNRRFGL